jgi:hypothetical protein
VREPECEERSSFLLTLREARRSIPEVVHAGPILSVLLLGDMRRLYGLNLCVLTIDRLPEVGASVVLDAGAEEVRRHRERPARMAHTPRRPCV